MSIIKDPSLAKEGLKEVEGILRDLLENNYEITSDFVEAKSLATVATIILREAVNK